MSVPPQRNLAAYQGDDWAVIVDVTDVAGEPADLTGYEVAAQVRHDIADVAAVAASMTTTVDAGSITLSLSHDETIVLGGDYLWDLELVEPSGGVLTLLAGKFTVGREVTRPWES